MVTKMCSDGDVLKTNTVVTDYNFDQKKWEKIIIHVK
jgi:hypothetical protein